MPLIYRDDTIPEHRVVGVPPNAPPPSRPRAPQTSTPNRHVTKAKGYSEAADADLAEARKAAEQRARDLRLAARLWPSRLSWPELEAKLNALYPQNSSAALRYGRTPSAASSAASATAGDGGPTTSPMTTAAIATPASRGAAASRPCAS
jgi:hypothetical protein